MNEGTLATPFKDKKQNELPSYHLLNPILIGISTDTDDVGSAPFYTLSRAAKRLTERECDAHFVFVCVIFERALFLIVLSVLDFPST